MICVFFWDENIIWRGKVPLIYPKSFDINQSYGKYIWFDKFFVILESDYKIWK